MPSFTAFESLQNTQQHSDVSSFVRTTTSHGGAGVGGRNATGTSIHSSVNKVNPSSFSPSMSPSLVSVLGSSSKKNRYRYSSDSTNYQYQRHQQSSYLTDGGLGSRTKPSTMKNISPSPLSPTPTPTQSNRGGGGGRTSAHGNKTPSSRTSSISPLRKSRNVNGSIPHQSINMVTPKQKAKFSCNTSSSSDRFIPNRSHMRVDLCRASLFSVEKKRLEFIEKKVTENNHSSTSLDSNASSTNGGGSNPSTPNNSASSLPTTTTEILTPIQSEYRSRMREALLSLPLDGSNHIDGSAISSGNSGGRGEVVTPSTPSGLNNAVTPRLPSREDRSNLAYAHLPEFDNENMKPGRMLSFRGNVTNKSFSSFSSTNVSKTKNNLQQSLPSFLSPDPFSHDQLRVLDRSAFGNTSTAALSYQNDGMSVANKVTRRINAAPTRILDAPELVDDYYLNLISWGSDNILAVALGQCVYLWNAVSGDINHLLTLGGAEDFVTSVKWAVTAGNTNYLAVGTNNGPVQLWDTEALRKVRTLGGHAARVGSLDWNQHWLSSGGRDSIIIQHDVRSAQHITSTYAGHTQEVCGLAWSEDGTTLASGGNENYLCIWDAAMSMRRSNSGRNLSRSNREPPRLTLTQHLAAVKALAWCPFHRGLLASGGGTADRTIKFWNSNSGAILNSIDTGSQVCSLLWSKHQRELCSSHGFSENQLILWRYPNMTKIQEFKGHTARVLHMEQSPDGASVVSAAADETLRFWDVFGPNPNKTPRDTISMNGFASRTSILR